jgi:membrane protein
MANLQQGQAALPAGSRPHEAVWHRILGTGRRTVWGPRAVLRDYVRRVWDNSAEDNIFFLASGVAFNIILAAIPFFLLLVSGVGYALHMSPTASLGNVTDLLDRLMPPGSGAGTAREFVHSLLLDLIRGRGRVGLYGAIGFIWFSTRLFGSLRSVLASVFDIDRDRGIIAGKWFDVRVTILATLLVVAYTALSAYLAIATTRGAQLLTDLGVERRAMGTLQVDAGRALAFVMIGLIFLCLYKYLPSRHIRFKKAAVSAGVAALLFELAKAAFRFYLRHYNPGSVYTGALAACAIVFLWIYYAALVFVIGGEVGQVYELRRVRRLQQMDVS